jgi:hypothetical protein
MSYGTIKVDTITFTDNSVDKSVSLSGLIQNPTFTGNITVTGTISGDVIRGGTTVSGATVTGTTANFVSGVFTTQISGATVTGTTASFTSGVFTNISGTTATITSGIIASGTAAAPSLAILADLDTGLFSPGANELAVATNGVQRLLIQSTGLTVNGTTTLNGTTLSLGAEGGANGFINTPESLYFNIDSNNNETGKAFIFAHNATDNTGAELFRIQDDGKVGIGTSSPSTLLHLSGLNSGGGSANTIRVTDTDTAVITDQICGRIEFETADTGNPGVNCQIDALYSGSGGGSKLQFRTGFAGALVDALHISDTGLVGIGTTSPGNLLHVSGTGTVCQLASSNNNNLINLKGNGATNGVWLGTTSSDDFVISSGASITERARIDSSGRLGIGTSSPSTTLSVAGGISGTAGANISGAGWGVLPYVANSLVIDNNAGETRFFATGADATTRGSFIFYNGETDGGAGAAMVIDSSSRVGIGTTSPTNTDKLEIQTSSTSAPGLWVQTGGTTSAYPIVDVRNGANLDVFAIKGDGTSYFQGKLGIGTTSPSASLHVQGANVSGKGQLIVSSASAGQEARMTFIDGSDDIAEISTDGNNLYFYNETATGAFQWYTNGSERALIDSSGRLLVGTSTSASTGTSQYALLQVQGWTGASTGEGIFSLQRGESSSAMSSNDPIGDVLFSDKDGGNYARISAFADAAPAAGDHPGRLTFSTTADGASTPTERLRITSAGLVGIGTTPGATLDVNGQIRANNDFLYADATATRGRVYGDSTGLVVRADTGLELRFHANAVERARIDTSGRLLVGMSSSGSVARLQVQGSTLFNDAFADLCYDGSAASGIAADTNLGVFRFTDQASNSNIFAQISCATDATASSGDYPGRLVFSTTADGASTPGERMRITSGGNVLVGKTSSSFGTGDGTVIGGAGYLAQTRTSATPFTVIRNGTDGTLVSFEAQNVEEGTISVSGTTVSYNGAHLSRWSQILGIDPYNKAVRPEILRGTVMSNLDEMCDWTCPTSGDCQDNEQLNKTKISDVEGDKNVAGIFQSWDDDDDTWVNDYYLAMTGDFVIRIAAGTTVERGDLLMSAGDGTAKPQADDLVRSCTVAKVTSANVSCTYDDGSYCVPCVLMAC